jgi:hypothetical protein
MTSRGAFPETIEGRFASELEKARMRYGLDEYALDKG